MTLMHSISMCWVTNRTAMRCLHESLWHILDPAEATALKMSSETWKCSGQQHCPFEEAHTSFRNQINAYVWFISVTDLTCPVKRMRMKILCGFSDEFTIKTTPKRSTCVHKNHQCLHLRSSSCDTNGDALWCRGRHNYPNKKHLLHWKPKSVFFLG